MPKFNLYNGEMSRRKLLTGATIATAGVALAGMTECAFAKKPKRSQADVAYQDHPKGRESCENCDPFIPPNACGTVEGEISPKGWCKIYVAA